MKDFENNWWEMRWVIEKHAYTVEGIIKIR